tara:strand:- start:5990 stop:6430 length:441 start_codon:yes stop_codon:yes gene_type:complete
MSQTKPRQNAKDPLKSIFLLFHQVNQKIDFEQNKVLQKYLLTPRQLIILQVIDYYPLLNLNDIQKYTKIDRTTVTEIIKKLENKELINSHKKEVDKRFKIIKINTKGRNILRKLQVAADETEAIFIKTLDFKTKKKFLNSLKQYTK